MSAKMSQTTLNSTKGEVASFYLKYTKSPPPPTPDQFRSFLTTILGGTLAKSLINCDEFCHFTVIYFMVWSFLAVLSSDEMTKTGKCGEGFFWVRSHVCLFWFTGYFLSSKHMHLVLLPGSVTQYSCKRKPIRCPFPVCLSLSQHAVSAVSSAAGGQPSPGQQLAQPLLLVTQRFPGHRALGQPYRTISPARPKAVTAATGCGPVPTASSIPNAPGWPHLSIRWTFGQNVGLPKWPPALSTCPTSHALPWDPGMGSLPAEMSRARMVHQLPPSLWMY